jgi:hypothetical protein
VIEKFHDFKIKKNTGYLVLGFSDDISKIVVLKEGSNKAPQNAPPEEKSLPDDGRRSMTFNVVF